MSGPDLIRSIGYAGLFAIVFAETGLLIGFFLPGDTLLISAGLLAARGQMHISLVLLAMISGAIIGDAVGYWIGHQAGRRLFQREDSFWFRRDHLEKAQRFYARHGGKTIVIARFFTGVRTFAPVIAGAAEMGYSRFAFFNALGAVSWVVSITMLGYTFGNVVSRFDHYIFIGAAILLPVPLVLGLSQAFRVRRARNRFQERLRAERRDSDQTEVLTVPSGIADE
jgi:membrane-associated protein